ncbi:hypothetical protein [Oscillibacter sp.]|uniref:hypothetical protein n=1 Tax=Oscillibacter sp. TaxID=1945593 RepID=UPI002899C374|nr:hypothetical protein [Oscillibacter sp.]
MNEILKSANIQKQALGDADLSLINQQALRALTTDEVFTFRLAACDNQVDRDFERFTDAALEGLAKLFVGRTVLMDHKWSAGNQTARVYAASVEQSGSVKQLVLRCYMPRMEQTAGTITAIESGILRECSVGCTVERAICSVCGVDNAKACCEHWQGREYDGQLCVMELDGAKDAYEVSLVAVPAQPGAGIIKSKRYGVPDGSQDPPAGAGADDALLRMAQAMQEQEEKRYGGFEK